MTSPVQGNTWSVNSDGSVTFNGSVWFPAATNTASGAGIVVFGPGGGRATFPAVEPGPPGPTPQLAFQQVQVAYGTPLPATNPVVTPTQWDANGIPTALSVVFYVNAGPPGAAGGTTILTATDLEGDPQAGYVIGYDPANNAAQWQPGLSGSRYFATGIAASSSTTVSQKSVGNGIAIPAMPFPYWPVVEAQAEVNGATDVLVDLVARINSNSGQICAKGFGQPGAAPPILKTTGYQLGIGSPNIIPANTRATILLFGEARTSSPNAWSLTSNCTFQVKVEQAPS